MSIASSCVSNSPATSLRMARAKVAATKTKESGRDLEQWQRDDAKRLKVLWEKRPKPRLSQVEFGATYGIGTQGMVWQYLHAHRALNPKAASGFAAGLSCQVSDFSPRLAREISKMAKAESRSSLEHFTLIDRYRDARHGAGPGVEADDNGDGEVDQIAFREDWLRKEGWNPRHLKGVPVEGPSMEPRIRSGDLLLVDTSQKTVKSGQVYAIWHQRRRRIKRLFVGADGSLRIRSDNPAPEFAEETVPPDKRDQIDVIDVIGLVVWVAGRVHP